MLSLARSRALRYVRTQFAGGKRKPCGESHAAAQEGKLHKKSDDARAGGAECTSSMMPRSYHRERGPPSELERRLATVR